MIIKTHMITDPEGLRLSLQFETLRAEFEAAEKEMNERHQIEAEAIATSFNKKKDDLWNELTDHLSLPRLEDNDGMDYKIDRQYYDEHQTIFLLVKQEDQCDCPTCRSRRGGSSLADILGNLLKDPAVG